MLAQAAPPDRCVEGSAESFRRKRAQRVAPLAARVKQRWLAELGPAGLGRGPIRPGAARVIL